MKEGGKDALVEADQGMTTNRFSARIYIKRSEEKEVLWKISNAESALAPFGIQLSVGPSRYQDSKSFLACVLNLRINHEITSRGAGRHAVETSLSLEDVESMIAQNMSPQEIADNVGFSLATYYRHMKKAIDRKETGQKPSEIPF